MCGIHSIQVLSMLCLIRPNIHLILLYLTTCTAAGVDFFVSVTMLLKICNVNRKSYVLVVRSLEDLSCKGMLQLYSQIL